MHLYASAGGASRPARLGHHVPARGAEASPYIKRISVRPFTNKTPQFGLEEKLTLKTIDEFLKNGEYSIAQENAAQGVIVAEISHYILTPYSTT